MFPRVAARLLLAATVLVVPGLGYAQEAVLTGTVADSTGAVLPGVTVTALLEATGNTFVAVTDERGAYRVPARVGAYSITAELQGFTTPEVPEVPGVPGVLSTPDPRHEDER